MKVLFVTRDIDVSTGTGLAERTQQLAKAVADRGNDVDILTLRMSAPMMAPPGRLRIHFLKCWNRRFFIPQPNLIKIWSLVRQSDAVCLMGYWSLLNVVTSWVCRAAGRPYTISPAGEWCAGNRSRSIKRIFDKLVGRPLLNHSVCVIAVTPDEEEEFARKGIPPTLSSVIPNGVCSPSEIPPFPPLRRRYGLTARPFVLFLGRLHWMKGPDLLLEAFSSISDDYPLIDLVFAGPDDGMRNELSERVRERHLDDRVKFAGFVSGNDRFSLLREALLLVIASRREMMSIVVLEAGINGTPVLMTDACGFNQLEKIGGGKLCRPDSAELARELRTLLNDQQGLPLMGRRLCEHVREHYPWSKSACQLMRILDSATRKGDSEPGLEDTTSGSPHSDRRVA